MEIHCATVTAVLRSSQLESSAGASEDGDGGAAVYLERRAAVLCSTTNGTGVITELKPQAAEAFTFTVLIEDAILVKYVRPGP